jgi:Zn-dependent protease
MWRDDEPQIFRGSNYDYRLQPYYPGPGPVTSNQEMLDLTIAVLALALIFAMPEIRAALFYGLGAGIMVLFFLLSLVAVMLGVFTHELAHKFVARSYGYWAEFRRSDTWLGIGLFMSFVGFGFIAAPGAVMIQGNVTTENNGKISAAGPGTNMLVGFTCLPLALLLGPGTLAGYIASTAVIVSAFLGIFNMLPIFPFDGSKVWRWSAPVYIGMVVGFVALILLADKYLHFLGIL